MFVLNIVGLTVCLFLAVLGQNSTALYFAGIAGLVGFSLFIVAVFAFYFSDQIKCVVWPSPAWVILCLLTLSYSVYASRTPSHIMLGHPRLEAGNYYLIRNHGLSKVEVSREEYLNSIQYKHRVIAVWGAFFYSLTIVLLDASIKSGRRSHTVDTGT